METEKLIAKPHALTGDAPAVKAVTKSEDEVKNELQNELESILAPIPGINFSLFFIDCCTKFNLYITRIVSLCHVVSSTRYGETRAALQ